MSLVLDRGLALYWCVDVELVTVGSSLTHLAHTRVSLAIAVDSDDSRHVADAVTPLILLDRRVLRAKSRLKSRLSASCLQPRFDSQAPSSIYMAYLLIRDGRVVP